MSQEPAEEAIIKLLERMLEVIEDLAERVKNIETLL